MKYFLIEEDKKLLERPYIVDWHDKLDVRDLHLERAYKIPERELLIIRSNQETLFTDIISMPFFLISAKVLKIIKMYEPKIRTKEIVLLDKVYGKAERYFLPLFDEVDCLDEESVFNRDHSEIISIVLNLKKLKGFSIFRIAGVDKQYIVGNLDIVESMLKRGCTGIQLEELVCMP